MMTYPQKETYTADDLLQIITLLRDPQQGCSWDKVQTHSSVRMNFLEEAYEAVDAIDLDDPELLCEELGDVLMQVVFHTVIEQEAGRFTWVQVCDGVCRKLIWRHPHVFGPQPGNEGINDWGTLKNKEKGRLTPAQDLQSVPHALPALMRAAKLQKRAANYPEMQHPTSDGLEAAAAACLAAPQGSAAAKQAVGELLFAAVALARAVGVDPEQALQERNQAYEQNAPETTIY